MNVTHLNRDTPARRLPQLALLLISMLALALASVGTATASTKVVPANTTPPAISGTTTEGQTLTATTGTWHGTIPFTYAYQWQRCDSAGGHCVNITGAKAATYTLKSADVNSALRVDVVATNGHGATGMTSAATAVVKPDPNLPAPTVTPAPAAASNGCATNGGTVAVDGISSPAHLNIDQFQTTPKTITFSTQSLTAHFHVTACGSSVAGAAVYATAVPFGLFAVPEEHVTNAEGWATVKLNALSGFPVSTKQQLLVMFVRATKPGDGPLGGVSGRRLVAIHVSKS
jgi:hypothetical protein